MNPYENRKKVIFGIILLSVLVIIVRLFFVQVLNEDYKVYAENNALSKQIVTPLRGIIYDRNGKVIVSNEVVYDLMVVPSQVRNIDTAEFCELLNISVEHFEQRLEAARKYSRWRPSVFVRQINIETYGRFQERLYGYNGFFVISRTHRTYPNPVAPHVLGYLGEVSRDDIANSENYYRMGDFKGISGIERTYETELRGQKGLKVVLVDKFNREQGSYREGELDIPGETGFHMVSTLDLDLQKYGELLMQNKKGSIVAIEPSTGEILAMISAPAYDPNELQGQARAQNYRRLLLDKDKPLFNRAISAMYPPGSTFKCVTAMIAMEDGIMKPEHSYSCGGAFFIGRLRVGCRPHPGPVELRKSIQFSCNAYYCNLFRNMVDHPKHKTTADGYNAWRDYLDKWGLGRRLGIDIPNESPGILPTQERYDRIYGKGRWKSSTIISLAIGQAEISLTPLQMANASAIIANRGHYFVPHLSRAFVRYESEKKPAYEPQFAGVDPKHYDVMVQAMFETVEAGTARASRINDITFAGKTGTSQNPHGLSHSLFIGFAPVDDPKIAIAVIVENAGGGGAWAAPIASLMVEKYLKGEITREQLETRILEADFINKK